MRWHLITGEYPPARGGVSDYTQQVAEGLAARGEDVQVLAPAPPEADTASAVHGGVAIRWLPGHYGWRGLRALERHLASQPAGGRLLVQYVPHAFGWKAMNAPLCRWLAGQRRHDLWVMFHEVAYPRLAGQPWRHVFLAWVNRWMARQLAVAADRVFVSTLGWPPLLDRLAGRAVPSEWLPIPSNFERCQTGGWSPDDERGGDAPPAGYTVGHFGTFSPWISERLEALLPAVLQRCPGVRVRLLGRGSREFSDRFIARQPALAARVRGLGELPPSEVVAVLQACDLLVQPYPDGISTRRTSAMCSVCLGRPVVTQAGEMTEEIWRQTGAVRFIATEQPLAWAEAVHALLNMSADRAHLGERGARAYKENFSLEKTLDVLLTSPPSGKISEWRTHSLFN